MRDFLRFFHCVARAVVKKGDRALAGRVLFRDVLDKIAAAAFKEYLQASTAADLPGELESLAQADPSAVQQAADAVAFREATGPLAALRPTLSAYLVQLRFTVRQALRRATDPTGTTAPAQLCPSVPEELVKFLPANLPRFKPGDQPLKGWELVDLLGTSDFGELWKARHRTHPQQKPVAIKLWLDPDSALNLANEPSVHDVLSCVREQGNAWNIAPLLETHLDNDPPCLVYEYIEAGDLAGLIRELQPEGKLTPELAVQLVHELAATMACAHRLNPPLVHGSLKLSNVLVRRGEDNGLSLLVTDFGFGALAAYRTLQEHANTRSTHAQKMALAAPRAYAPLYASPQQGADRPLEPCDDVHALGMIWYQLVTGDLSLSALPSDWRDAVEERGLDEKHIELLASCLAPRVEKRLPSAVELVDGLAALSGPRARRPVVRAPGDGARTETASRPPVPASAPAAPSKPAPRPGEIVSVGLGQGIEMQFVWIPPGTFLMGSPLEEDQRHDDEKQHWVTLTREFYLGIHPVTQAQWRAVMGNNPSRFKAAERPVDSVSWDQCVEFCKKLRQKTGKRFRLPTEAEWEYACRAGSTTEYYSGTGVAALRQVGWCSYDDKQGSAKETIPVGLLQPNAWGLFDMHGNVWEWCRDWYGFLERDETDPVGPGFGKGHVLRGGSWFYGPRFCRSARRAWAEAGRRHYADFGCRVVLSPS